MDVVLGFCREKCRWPRYCFLPGGLGPGHPPCATPLLLYSPQAVGASVEQRPLPASARRGSFFPGSFLGPRLRLGWENCVGSFGFLICFLSLRSPGHRVLEQGKQVSKNPTVLKARPCPSRGTWTAQPCLGSELKVGGKEDTLPNPPFRLVSDEQPEEKPSPGPAPGLFLRAAGLPLLTLLEAFQCCYPKQVTRFLSPTYDSVTQCFHA